MVKVKQFIIQNDDKSKTAGSAPLINAGIIRNACLKFIAEKILLINI